MLAKISNRVRDRKTKDDIDANELWCRFINNNEEAISELFCRYYSHLYNYGYNIVQKQDLVKDCIQELFLHLWKKRHSLSEAVSVNAYLFSSFRRKILRKIQRQKNRKSRNELYIEQNFTEAYNIEEIMIHFEVESSLQKNLNKAINSLSKKQKETIYLKFYHGLTSNEIAEIMDINKQTVYNHVSEAISNMQSYVKV